MLSGRSKKVRIIGAESGTSIATIQRDFGSRAAAWTIANTNAEIVSEGIEATSPCEKRMCIGRTATINAATNAARSSASR